MSVIPLRLEPCGGIWGRAMANLSARVSALLGRMAAWVLVFPSHSTGPGLRESREMFESSRRFPDDAMMTLDSRGGSVRGLLWFRYRSLEVRVRAEQAEIPAGVVKILAVLDESGMTEEPGAIVRDNPKHDAPEPGLWQKLGSILELIASPI